MNTQRNKHVWLIVFCTRAMLVTNILLLADILYTSFVLGAYVPMLTIVLFLLTGFWSILLGHIADIDKDIGRDKDN